MIRSSAIPSSIASRVRTGRQSIACLSSCARRRCLKLVPSPTALGWPPNCSGGPSARTTFPLLNERKLAVLGLGLHVGYWGLGLTPEDQLALVREAEAAGFDSVWAAEAYGSDAATVLAWLAARTERIRIGSAIFQMPARSPAMTAMTAATLDHISHGRMLLGIGSSGPQVAERWHGQRFARQLQRTREYVAIVRMALRRERVDFHGETLELPRPDGPGKPLKLMIAPGQEQSPIQQAAIG